MIQITINMTDDMTVDTATDIKSVKLKYIAVIMISLISPALIMPITKNG